MSTTSLKLPDKLKDKAIAAARIQGVTPHAFMVDAIRMATAAAEQLAEFVAQAKAARADLMRTGKGYAASDVHTYLRNRASGKKATKPKATAWRG